MHQTSPLSFGKLSNLEEVGSTLCVHILACQVSRAVRTMHPLSSCQRQTIRLDPAEETETAKRAPITVKFEIPYFTVSGIQVRYLKIVEKSGYQALPWVRYVYRQYIPPLFHFDYDHRYITQHGDDYR